MFEISGTAWSSDPLRLPEDTRRALETDGRPELLKLLDLDRRPESSAAAPAAATTSPPRSGRAEREPP
jgi:hypothetical protein